MHILHSSLFIIFAAKTKKDDEKEEAAPGDSLIPTLPDVKMCAAKAIARCARNSEYISLQIVH